MVTIVSLLMFGLGVAALALLFKLFSWPLKMLWKLLLNAFMGALTLLLINIVGRMFGFAIPINAVSSLIVGFMGVPGVVLLAVWHFIF